MQPEDVAVLTVTAIPEVINRQLIVEWDVNMIDRVTKDQRVQLLTFVNKYHDRFAAKSWNKFTCNHLLEMNI